MVENLIESISFSRNGSQLRVEAFTDRLYIRSYDKEDFERCLALYGDKELTKYFDHGKPRSYGEILEYVEDRGSRYFDQGLPFGIFSVFLKGGVFVGQVDLVPTENPGEVEDRKSTRL